MIEDQRGEQAEHRWNRVWALAPYPLLALATAVSLVSDATAWPVILPLVALLSGWHGWFVLAHPRWPERAGGPMAVYFTGLLAATATLVRLDNAFALFVPACYALAFVTLPGALAYLGVLATSGIFLLPAGADPRSVLVNLAFATPMAGMIGWIIRSMEREGIRRREANTRLTAMAEENTRLASAAAVVEERARVAREMHDTLAQGLTGIVTQLEVAETLTADGDPVRGRIATARRLARDSLVEVRRAIDALRPGPLREARLGEAIGQAVATWRDQHQAVATCVITGDPRPLHPELEITLLRAAQETLANAGRHARADRVDLTLSYMEDVVVLDVLDNGTGFDPATADGFGLTALRERVHRLAGTVTVESAPGEGTAVNVTLPVLAARP
ncbi:sensor histidine kinase [Crossiella sp. CA198]|uniref:sensor histidine kinase n=1 Tax=Crossiella sp. CA198 TaxID=3455607 RepID=UPI003F8D0727